MKNKKIVFVIITIIIMVISMGLLITNKPKTTNQYDIIIKKINNNETFSIAFIKEDNSNAKEIFEYYEKAYSINIKYIYVEQNDSNYRSLAKKLNLSETRTSFIVIKAGKIISGITGIINEHNLKKVLIDAELISKEYESIDQLISNDFKNTAEKNVTYNILYIDSNHKNLYKYRELLVSNKIKSLVLYANNVDQIQTENYIKEKIGIKKGDYSKLPIVMKVRNNKVLNTHSNVKPNDLVRYCR